MHSDALATDPVAAFWTTWTAYEPEQPLPYGWLVTLRMFAAGGLDARDVRRLVAETMRHPSPYPQAYARFMLFRSKAWQMLTIRSDDPGEEWPAVLPDGVARPRFADWPDSECPRCGAAARTPCITATGNVAWEPHQPRLGGKEVSA